MKKIILAAAIICAAAISQAAAVGWSCTAVSWKNCDYSVFVIGVNGCTGTDQIKAIVAAGGLGKADGYAFASGLTASGTGAATVAAESSGKSITYSGSGTDSYSMFLVFEAADGKSASFTALKALELANDSTSKSVAFANQATALSSNTFTVNTPEPTSGVLLLLGMAGLALKRKRV